MTLSDLTCSAYKTGFELRRTRGTRHERARGLDGAGGSAARLEIRIREPEVTYTVSVMQVQRWLQGATANPSERLKRDRLRGLLSSERHV